MDNLIFDADGVLFDSEPHYTRAVQETFRHYGVEITTEEYVRRWMIEQTYTKGVIRDYDIKDSIDNIRERKAEIMARLIQNELEMIPHAMEMVERLCNGYQTGIVTSSSRRDIMMKLKKFSLVDFFPLIVASGDTERSKPHPDPYQKMVDMMKADPGKTVVIEDNPSGVRSAKAVKPGGCRVIAYPNGFTGDMDFSHADIIVSSLEEIDKGMIKRLLYPVDV